MHSAIPKSPSPFHQSVLIGTAKITIERSTTQATNSPTNTGGTSVVPLTSEPGQIINPGGYGFIISGGGANPVLKVLDLQNINQSEPEQIVKEFPLDNLPWRARSVSTLDRSRAYVTSANGVIVIDAVALRKHDQEIAVPGGSIALAVDPQQRYLYASSGDNIYIIDIQPGSETFHDVVDVIDNIDTPFGLISDLAVNADGTKIYGTAPATTMYGGVSSYTSGARESGKIVVVNVDEADRTSNGQAGGPRKWREVIGHVGRRNRATRYQGNE